ncbi:hypothetical protein AB0L75_41025 [Streptomyces sp. NPDC052101]|uniref:hypothetical protein n=1 Tax=Streptomyces sp. NPDC052101 TaxID=3155763 RepID=UPI00344827B7
MDPFGERQDLAAVVLLCNLQAWRLRAVERVQLSNALWSERYKEIHVRPLAYSLTEKKVLSGCSKQARSLRAVLKVPPTEAGRTPSAKLILPIADMPRIPLLDLRITVAGQHVYRIPLDESARIQAKYVSHLGGSTELINGSCLEPELIDLLTSIFYFPPHPFNRICASRKNTDLAQYDYLLSENDVLPTGWKNSYPDWKNFADKIATLASKYVLPERANSSEHPLIVLPYFFQELHAHSETRYNATTAQDITLLLEKLHFLLDGAANPPVGASDEEKARRHRFASAYYGYGLRWMAFARCVVPLDEPFTITVEHKRAVYFTKTRDTRDRLSKTVWTTIAFADAETNHISFRASDTAVRLEESHRVLQENGDSLKDAKVDEETSTFELYLRQDSTRNRTERILIGIRLHLTRLHSSMLWVAILITGFAFGLLVWRGVVEFRHASTKGRTFGLTAKDASVILIPVAFAASFLLSRDSSTLSSRIKRLPQALLTVELFLLFALAFFLFLLHYIRPG